MAFIAMTSGGRSSLGQGSNPSASITKTAALRLANRAYLRRRGITARIARREVESSTRLGRHRWKVERSLSWLSCFRRLQVRWDRDTGRWFTFVLVAGAVAYFNRL